MPVSELVNRMSSEELTEWLAYWQLEPFGAWRDNWHAAQQLALQYNTHRGKNQALKASEFFYKDPDLVRESNTRQFLAGLDALAE